MNYKVIHGDCIEELANLPANSIDAIVTDPPYHLYSIVKRFGKENSAPAQYGTDGAFGRVSKGFMGKEWDGGDISYRPETWAACLRVLKPGGHMLCFGGSRTFHRIAVAIEDAGFELRDTVMWVYAQGFPKSLDVSKAIDKKPKANRVTEFKEWLRKQIDACPKTRAQIDSECGFTACSYSKTDGKDYWSSNLPKDGKWQIMKEVLGITTDEYDWVELDNTSERGYIEPTGGLHGGSGNTVGRFTGGQLSNDAVADAAKQWQGWGTALKPAFEPVILARKPLDGTVAANVLKWGTGAINIDGCRVGTETITQSQKDMTQYHGNSLGAGHEGVKQTGVKTTTQGRWPSTFIHDGSEEVLELMPETKSGTGAIRKTAPGMFGLGGDGEANVEYGDSGSAARFFKQCNYSASDLEEAARFKYCPKASKKDRNEGCEEVGGNQHPTLKPTSLMRYLCRLITPPNGTILDPFMGSGSTGKAAMLEGFNFIGIEKEQEYIQIAEARIEYARKNRSDILDDDIRDETDGDPTLFNCV